MTIWMLYTAWALIIATGLLLRLFIGPRCAHAWELVDKVEFSSQLEETKKLGYKFSDLHGVAVDAALLRSVTVVMRCPRCGACKILKVTS